LPQETAAESKGWAGKLAAWTAVLVAVGGLADAAISLAGKTESITCGFGFSLPWCATHTTNPTSEEAIDSQGVRTKAFNPRAAVAIASCDDLRTYDRVAVGVGESLAVASKNAMKNCDSDCCKIQVTSDNRNTCIAFAASDKGIWATAAAPTIEDAKAKAKRWCSDDKCITLAGTCANKLANN
jgi:hypothetical protein